MIQALNKYVICEEIEDNEETKTKYGIIVASGNEDRKSYYGIYGTVVSVSETAENDLPKRLKKGDKILFNKHEAVPFRHEGKDFQAILGQWIIAKK